MKNISFMKHVLKTVLCVLVLFQALFSLASSSDDVISPINDRSEREIITPENLTTWVFEDGTFIPMAKMQGEKSYSIITDHLGTPTEAYDEDGEKVWSRQLNIYGETRKETGFENFIPFLYQGQYLDSETGLCYNRFRYYSPESGTYISQDPIGLLSDQLNFYLFSKDVNVWIDQFGLKGAKACVAVRVPGGIKKGKAVSFKEALKIIRNGGDILASSRKQAIQLAKNAFKGKPMKHAGHDLVGGGKGLPHVHPAQHINSSHIFYN